MFLAEIVAGTYCVRYQKLTTIIKIYDKAIYRIYINDINSDSLSVR